MMPVRCYTCNALLAHQQPVVARRKREGETLRAVLDDLGVVRVCCRTAFIAFAPVHEDTKRFSARDLVLDDLGTRYCQFVAHQRVVDCGTGAIQPDLPASPRADPRAAREDGHDDDDDVALPDFDDEAEVDDTTV